MKKISLVLSAAAALVFSSTVSASLITLDSRAINTAIDSADFASSWTNQTSTISSSLVDTFDSYRTGNNTINLMTIDFDMNSAGSWGFDLALDAGYGAAFYLDGNLVSNRTDNLWWAYNWNSSDVMRVLDNTLTAGDHKIEIFWAENCCNGASSAKFTTDGINWQALSSANIAAAASVAEPATIALFSIGLVGLSLSRMKRKS
ncbi:CCXG family PEP-CTERM protein [Alkalimarinus sediminis]|uniref:CCXG family PEP-CTERM protein n=1 Tax=Alkalimarinus sediminis TaxID=1632866 RepID=A0A9E8HQ37_9ALTE|nr:CCXG family PEP-CTERM protein [Alkalimarinus sediminis]UZW74471.1 CCXG family PEP-CTERM protein [Alkalimarinus sediminis]